MTTTNHYCDVGMQCQRPQPQRDERSEDRTARAGVGRDVARLLRGSSSSVLGRFRTNVSIWPEGPRCCGSPIPHRRRATSLNVFKPAVMSVVTRRLPQATIRSAPTTWSSREWRAGVALLHPTARWRREDDPVVHEPGVDGPVAQSNRTMLSLMRPITGMPDPEAHRARGG
jgi:hypothetical protein